MFTLLAYLFCKHVSALKGIPANVKLVMKLLWGLFRIGPGLLNKELEEYNNTFDVDWAFQVI